MNNDREHDLARRVRTATVLWNEAARNLDQGKTGIAAALARVGGPMLEHASQELDRQEGGARLIDVHGDVDPSRTVDDRARRALGLLVVLLELPAQRPGSWEAEHVEALEVEHLAPIFDALTGSAQHEGADGEPAEVIA